MKSKKLNSDTYAVRFELDEEILSALTTFAKENDIQFAKVDLIGAVKDVEIGYYALAKKTYIKKTFSEEREYELIHTSGNIARLENGDPFVHVHTTLGKTDYTTIGGHLFSGKVAVTVEGFIQIFSEKVIRTPDNCVGIKTWDL